jgi:Flp pilus assembly protein TadD
VALAVVAGWRWLAARRPTTALRLCGVAAATAVVGLSALTVHRVAAYETVVTIWRDAVERQPTDPMSHYNLGVALLDEHRADEAIRSFEQTLRLEPDHVMALDNLGGALERAGRPQDAVAPPSAADRSARRRRPQQPRLGAHQARSNGRGDPAPRAGARDHPGRAGVDDPSEPR